MLTSIVTIIVTKMVGEQAIINAKEVIVLRSIIKEGIVMAVGQNDIVVYEKTEAYTITTANIEMVGTTVIEIVVDDINRKTYRSISICFLS